MLHCICFPLASELLVESVLENVTLCTLCNCSISSVVLSPSCVVLCISTVGIIQIVYHVYILFSEHALHWFSRVLFIATQREIMSLTELIKVENVNKYIFPKLKKNEISMFLCISFIFGIFLSSNGT
jgi:hypothetical protein